ncbi:unnamed protein product [Sphenostylis stenocarpa]|uniref:Hydrophobic seed protein domain-containing protein n=1 Tax=Sphenostylis stenocarpa TaxID=92480 RepID=A0AA86SRZ6_9FABA|nr:unnamed protein product [Sphenostylis stenocarpa]
MALKATTACTYVVALLLCLNMLPVPYILSSTYIPVVPDPLVPYQKGTCPIDAVKLGMLLNMVNVKLGSLPTLPCCSLIKDLADLEVDAVR